MYDPLNASEIDAEELLALFRGGDRAAAEEIFGRYHQSLSDFARKHVPKHVRACAGGTRDLTQSIFVDLLEHPLQGVGNSRAAKRLFGEADNELWRLLISMVVRHYEKHKKRAQKRPHEYRAGELTQDPAVLDRADRESARDVVEEIGIRLNSREYEVFLRYSLPKMMGWQHPTQHHLAQTLNVSVKTIERSLARIMDVVADYAAAASDRNEQAD